jgi:hypothetical protein
MDRKHISGHMPQDPETPEYCLFRNFWDLPSKYSPSVQQVLTIS